MPRHLRSLARTALATAMFCAGAALTAGPALAAPAAAPTPATDPTQIEQIAAAGYVYGVGPVAAARTRADMLCHSAVNTLVNQTNLATPLTQAVVAPNVDTLYSTAWLDLRQGPVVLSIPDMGDRYHVLQLLDIYTNTFADLGTRVDGQQAGQYAVVPPGWTGTLPAGTQRVDAPTWDVWMLGRTLVNGPDDLDAARAAQAGYAVTPEPGGTTGTVPPPLQPAASCTNPPDPTMPGDGGAEFFDELANVLAADPAPAADQPILDQLASIGVTPGSMPSEGDPTTVSALAAGVTDGEAQVQSAASSVLVPSGTWFASLDAGTYGVDYLTRAAIAMKVLGANIPAESIYYLSGLDANGHALTGSTTYTLHFPANGLPPVDASGFWSVTMYNADMYLVPNAQRRYSIGDRTSGLVYNADGSLDIYLSNRPPVGHTANWLPAPSGTFNLITRAYVPLSSALDNTWHPPAITPVS
jgi:hypothetical protein